MFSLLTYTGIKYNINVTRDDIIPRNVTFLWKCFVQKQNYLFAINKILNYKNFVQTTLMSKVILVFHI